MMMARLQTKKKYGNLLFMQGLKWNKCQLKSNRGLCKSIQIYLKGSMTNMNVVLNDKQLFFKVDCFIYIGVGNLGVNTMSGVSMLARSWFNKFGNTWDSKGRREYVVKEIMTTDLGWNLQANISEQVFNAMVKGNHSHIPMERAPHSHR